MTDIDIPTNIPGGLAGSNGEVCCNVFRKLSEVEGGKFQFFFSHIIWGKGVNRKLRHFWLNTDNLTFICKTGECKL